MDICTLHYEDKEIPVTYKEDLVQSRLDEAQYMLKKAKEYFDTIDITQEMMDLSIAKEVMASSYIEGYEMYRFEDWLIKAEKGGTQAEKANLSGYKAYKAYWESLNVPSNKEELRDLWRILVKYKFYLTNFRRQGVRVGNRFHTSHVAPNQRFVRGLLDEMYTNTLPEFNDNAILQSLIFHYLFTYIHPFLDGNGRTARLIEQLIIQKQYNLKLCIPISEIILQDKKAYYKTFKSGQTFGEDHLDVLSIDITDFINNNCSFIIRGIQKIVINNGYSKIHDEHKLPDELNFFPHSEINTNIEENIDIFRIPESGEKPKFREIKQEFKEFKHYTREEIIDICGSLQEFCELQLEGKITERDYGYTYSERGEKVMYI